MQTVKMSKATLIDVVVANKAKHINEYCEAVIDFANLVINISNHNKDVIEAGKSFDNLKAIPAAPVSYEASYTKALLMLEYSVDDVIELEVDDFEKLVQDDWAWKHHFSVSNTAYKTSF